jgi:hypothetical protein
LVAPEQALDLDDPAYLVADDVVAYVRRCLLMDADPAVVTPYHDQPGLAGRVAVEVARQAGGSFLVAQLVSLALVNAGQVVNEAQPGWQEQFPREVGTAMHAYLDGFGAIVRDLLVPVAFAEGEGLASEALWAALASELGTAAYTPQDVRSLFRDTSAPDLLQPIELADETVAWRLFHEALAEHLRDHALRELHMPAREVQGRITQVLADRTPIRDGRRDWLATDPYTRAHLSSHAAAAGRLDEFATDPGVLLAGEPARLLRVLPSVTSQTGRIAARAYQQAAHHLAIDRPLGERASCLQRAACYCGAVDLAERIEGLGLELPWKTRWAHWRATGISRQLTGYSGPVNALAVGMVDGQPVIVSSSDDGTVRLWDARSGKPWGKAITGSTSEVIALALGEVDGQPVVVSGDSSGSSLKFVYGLP